MRSLEWSAIDPISRITTALASTLNPLLSSPYKYSLITDNLEESKLKPSALALNYINYLQESNKNEYLWEQSKYSSNNFGIFRLFSCWQTPNVSSALMNLLKTYDVQKASLEDAAIWDKLGLVFFETRMYRESDLCYSMSLKIAPENINVLYHKGVLCQIMDQKLNALRVFDQVVTLCKKFCGEGENQENLISALFHIGVIQLQLDRLDEAIENLTAVLSYDDKRTAVILLLADCLERQLRYSEAAELLNKARLLDPNDFRIKKSVEHISLLAQRSKRFKPESDMHQTAVAFSSRCQQHLTTSGCSQTKHAEFKRRAAQKIQLKNEIKLLKLKKASLKSKIRAEHEDKKKIKKKIVTLLKEFSEKHNSDIANNDVEMNS